MPKKIRCKSISHHSTALPRCGVEVLLQVRWITTTSDPWSKSTYETIRTCLAWTVMIMASGPVSRLSAGIASSGLPTLIEYHRRARSAGHETPYCTDRRLTFSPYRLCRLVSPSLPRCQLQSSFHSPLCQTTHAHQH
jgi:hypothetical protein